MEIITKYFNDERGATAIEYGLIASLIAIAAVTTMTNVGVKLNKIFTNVSANLKSS